MNDQQRTEFFGGLSSALNKAAGPVARACYHHGVEPARIAEQDADAIAALKELSRELAEKLPILEGAKLLSMSDGTVREVDPGDKDNPFFKSAFNSGLMDPAAAQKLGFTR